MRIREKTIERMRENIAALKARMKKVSSVSVLDDLEKEIKDAKSVGAKIEVSSPKKGTERQTG